MEGELGGTEAGQANRWPQLERLLDRRKHNRSFGWLGDLPHGMDRAGSRSRYRPIDFRDLLQTCSD